MRNFSKKTSDNPGLAHSIKYSVLLVLLLAINVINVQAQIYPVQVMPQLIAPYTANVPEYYSGTTEKFVVLLVNTDLTKPTLQVKLKLTIEGAGINLTSRSDVYYPAIDLDAGVAQRISLNDLAPYFDANNLIFSGMTRAQYQQYRKLPEGFYKFCTEVYEYNTNRLVGRSNCAMAWISLLDPPFLNLPRTSESIAYHDPTNIVFQWTPRNMTSPTAAFSTEYEFTLVELWDNGVAPEAAFSSSQPLYRTTTQATTLLYGPSEPLLIPGKRYGWRVKAQASDGSQNSDAYKNNGYSEIYWFTYQRNCPAPFNVQCDVSGGRATITWSANAQQNRYTVDYREKNQSGSAWYTVNSTTNRVMLYDLKKDKQYEYRVGGFCDIADGSFPADGAVYSDIKNFSLNGSSKDERLACGILQPELKIANRTPIQSLISGEIITAGDFPVKLISVQGSNGNFTGNGYVTVPLLGKAAVKVRFSNINVNTDKQLIGGLIETTYDAKETQIVAVDTIIDNLQNVAIASKAAISNLVEKIYEKLENNELANIYMKQLDEYFNDPSNTQITAKQKQYYNEHKDEIKDAVLQGIVATKEKITKEGIDKEDAKKYLASNLVENTSQNVAAKQEQADRINAAIDYDKLVNWLRDNKGKTVPYSIKNFLIDENASLGLGNGSAVQLSKAYKYTVNGETKTLQLTGILSNEDGMVTLSPANTLSPVSIDFANNKIHYYEDHYFDGKPKGDINSIAIRLTTNSFTDLDYLLQLQGYEQGENLKQYYQKIFDNGFVKAGGDCDKIDVLYAELPPFVTRSDEDKWRDLVSLSNCRIDEIGTNEYKAIINLLKGFDAAFLYSKLQTESETFEKLASKMSDDYIIQFGLILTKTGAEKWTEAQVNSSPHFLMYEYTEESASAGLDKNADKITISSCYDYDKASGKYGFGSSALTKDATTNMIKQASDCKKEWCLGFEPVKVDLQDYIVYLPALVVSEIAGRGNTKMRQQAAGIAATVLLPEAPNLALKVNRSIKLLFNIGVNEAVKTDKAITAVAPYLEELEQAGISIRQMTEKDFDMLVTIKSNNNVKAEVNLAKAEISMNNGESYSIYATSGYPDPRNNNILSSPIGASNAKKGNSVFEQFTSTWEGLQRVNDTEVKLLEEFALRNGAKTNTKGQVFNEVRGDIKLYTQLCPCGSCTNVIKAFKEMFPNVNLEIYTTPLNKFK